MYTYKPFFKTRNIHGSTEIHRNPVASEWSISVDSKQTADETFIDDVLTCLMADHIETQSEASPLWAIIRPMVWALYYWPNDIGNGKLHL